MTGLLIRDLAQVVTPGGADGPLRGLALRDVQVIDDAYIAETGASKWPAASSRRRDLREVTNQHAGHGVAVGFGAVGVAAVGCTAVGAAVVTLAMLGRSSPPSRAASSASG